MTVTPSHLLRTGDEVVVPASGYRHGGFSPCEGETMRGLRHWPESDGDAVLVFHQFKPLYGSTPTLWVLVPNDDAHAGLGEAVNDLWRSVLAVSGLSGSVDWEVVGHVDVEATL